MGTSTVRVFFVNRYFFPDESATSQLLSDLAFALARSGVDIHIICSRQRYGEPGASLPAHELIRGVVVHRVLTTRFGRRRLAGRALDYFSFYMSCGLALLRLLSRSDIVVAKTDPPLISVVAAVVAKLKGATLVNWLQDVFPEVACELGANPWPAALDEILRRLRDASLRTARCNVVIGSRMLEYLTSRGMSQTTFRIVENWADPDILRPKKPSDSTLRARLGLDGRFVVGYSGNLGRAHEIEAVLGAAEALRDDAAIAFLFIGGGVKMDELKTLAGQRKLANIHFLPYQPRESLEDSLAAADAHLAILIPSLEGLIVPSKFYGILAAGRPAIFVGDSDGELARIVRDTHCGLVVNAGDGAGLAQAIRFLQGDSHERDAMGRSARDLVCARYAARLGIAAWSAIIEDIANSAPKS